MESNLGRDPSGNNIARPIFQSRNSKREYMEISVLGPKRTQPSIPSKVNYIGNTPPGLRPGGGAVFASLPNQFYQEALPQFALNLRCSAPVLMGALVNLLDMCN